MTKQQSKRDFLDMQAENQLYDQMREHFWFPVAYSDELTDEPQGFTLLL